jgi:hypothetical protein
LGESPNEKATLAGGFFHACLFAAPLGPTLTQLKKALIS